MNKPTVSHVGDAITFLWAEGIEASLDRFHDSRGDITAEATFYNHIPGEHPGLLHSARLNLMSTQARGSLAKALSGRVNEIDWPGLLEQLCYLAVNEYRDGEPPVNLCAVDPYQQTRWLLYPYVERGGPTIMFGEGGSGKSVLAMWMALHIALGPRDQQGQSQDSKPVLYLDYETSQEVHAERMNALCAGLGIDLEARPPIYYRRMKSSLSQSAQAIRRDIDKLGIGMVVVDSLGGAGDGPPEESGTAITLFQSIRSFPVPALCIHHKRKGNGQRGENQRDRLFGSVYYLNFARMAWEIACEDDEGADVKTVGLIHCKANNGRLQKRHALQIEFENDAELDRCTSIIIRKMDMADVPELAGRVSLRDRIVNELERHAMTANDLSDALSTDVNQVKVRLSQLKKTGLLVGLPGHQWGLASHAEPPPF